MSDPKKLKVAFLTALDISDRRSYSGSFYYMVDALKRNISFEVQPITLVTSVQQSINNNVHKVTQSSPIKKKFRHLFSYYNAFRFARLAKRKMKGYNFDFIIAPAATREIALLKTNIPIVYITDSTWELLINYYPNYTNLANLAIWQGNIIERKAIINSSLLFFSSQWAIDSAINKYGAEPLKTYVIPWGANMDQFPVREDVLNKKPSAECKLLFVGKVWERKGGQIAIETLLELEKLGVNAHLTICGCKPPGDFAHPRVTVIEDINKNDERQHKQLEELFLTSDFFILPTRAECFGMVFSEAAAYGLPVITTNTGGLSAAVMEGVNGFLLPLEARGDQYAKLVKEIYIDKVRYNKLVRSSRDRFELYLNWDAWANTLAKKLNEYKTSHPNKKV